MTYPRGHKGPRQSPASMAGPSGERHVPPPPLAPPQKAPPEYPPLTVRQPESCGAAYGSVGQPAVQEGGSGEPVRAPPPPQPPGPAPQGGGQPASSGLPAGYVFRGGAPPRGVEPRPELEEEKRFGVFVLNSPSQGCQKNGGCQCQRPPVKWGCVRWFLVCRANVYPVPEPPPHGMPRACHGQPVGRDWCNGPSIRV